MKVSINKKLYVSNKGSYIGQPPISSQYLFEYMPNFSTGNYDTIFNQLDTTYGKSKGVNNPVDNQDITYNQNSTIHIKKEDGNIFEFDSTTKNQYTVSFWTKINRFPKHNYETTGNPIRRKRSKLLSLKYSDNANGYQNFTNTYSGMIDFGFMAPYYLYDYMSNYKYIFEPFSFTCTLTYSQTPDMILDTRGGFRNVFSVYTDYEYNLNTWYFITLSITPITTTNFDIIDGNYEIKMFIDNQQVNIANHRSDVITNPNSIAGRNGIYFGMNRRKSGEVAAGPYFINRNGDTITNSTSMNYYFHKFIYLNNLNSISYSPIIHRQNLNIGNGTKAFETIKNTGIDFGKLYIYDKDLNNTYDELSGFYNP